MDAQMMVVEKSSMRREAAQRDVATIEFTEFYHPGNRESESQT